MFQAPPLSLLERTLRILVYNVDVNRKHRVLGESRLELSDVDLSQGRLVRLSLRLRTVGEIHPTRCETLGSFYLHSSMRFASFF